LLHGIVDIVSECFSMHLCKLSHRLVSRYADIVCSHRYPDIKLSVMLLSSACLFSVLAKRLAGKSVSDMTYVVSSGTLNLDSINQSACLHSRRSPQLAAVRCLSSCFSIYLYVYLIWAWDSEHVNPFSPPLTFPLITPADDWPMSVLPHSRRQLTLRSSCWLWLSFYFTVLTQHLQHCKLTSATHS